MMTTLYYTIPLLATDYHSKCHSTSQRKKDTRKSERLYADGFSCVKGG